MQLTMNKADYLMTSTGFSNNGICISSTRREEINLEVEI